MLVTWFGCLAQDVITMANGESISAIVTEIGGSDVKYKKASNPNGPTYTVARKEIARILYQNGETEYFSESKKEAVQHTVIPETPAETAERSNSNQTIIYTGSYNPGRVSDAGLMKAYIIERANKMKKTSIIGGSCLMGLGVAAFVGIAIWTRTTDGWSDEGISENTLIGAAIGAPLVIGGAVWMLAAHHRANKLIQSVNYMSLLEQEVFSSRHNALTASVDYIQSRGYCRSNGVGLSLKYTF